MINAPFYWSISYMSFSTTPLLPLNIFFHNKHVNLTCRMQKSGYEDVGFYWKISFQREMSFYKEVGVSKETGFYKEIGVSKE